MKRLLLLSLLVPLELTSVGPNSALASPRTASLLEAPSQELGDDARALIKEGQKYLFGDEFEAALKRFEAADKASENHPDTHVWVLRTWMDMGRLNDAFNEADKMRESGVDTAGLDYIYGVGSLYRAKQLLDAKGNPGLAFGDAVSYLQALVDRDPNTYPDAWISLARASWWSQELDRAKVAIEKAVALKPDSAKVRGMQGEIYFSLYKRDVLAAKGEEVAKDDAQTALAAYARAAELTPDGKENAAEKFIIWNQVGNVHAWLKDMAKASESFAEALSWDPMKMNYQQMMQAIPPVDDPTHFVNAVEQGLAGYKKRFGDDAPAVGAMLWWQGYGQYVGKKYPEAETTFLASVKANKDYANAWFYVGLSRYYRQDYHGSCEAWLTYRDISPGSLAASINEAPDFYMPILRFSAGKVIATGMSREGTLEHLRIGEKMNQAMSEAQPTNTEFWNNLGLLRRDIGSITMRRDQNAKTADIMALFESSFDAYSKALQFAPEDPGYLNDAAVLLHYYLGRDADKAREYYERAAKNAQKWIDAKSWEKAGTPEEKTAEEERIRTALRDSVDNLKKLETGEIGTRGPRDK